MTTPRTTLFYLRDPLYRPFGAVFLSHDDNETFTRIGVSICNPKDEFNRRLGTTIATQRAGTVGTDRESTLTGGIYADEDSQDFRLVDFLPEHIRLLHDGMEKTFQDALRKVRNPKPAA